jgi:hypothetical protein
MVRLFLASVRKVPATARTIEEVGGPAGTVSGYIDGLTMRTDYSGANEMSEVSVYPSG